MASIPSHILWVILNLLLKLVTVAPGCKFSHPLYLPIVLPADWVLVLLCTFDHKPSSALFTVRVLGGSACRVSPVRRIRFVSSRTLPMSCISHQPSTRPRPQQSRSWWFCCLTGESFGPCAQSLGRGDFRSASSTGQDSCLIRTLCFGLSLHVGLLLWLSPPHGHWNLRSSLGTLRPLTQVSHAVMDFLFISVTWRVLSLLLLFSSSLFMCGSGWDEGNVWLSRSLWPPYWLEASCSCFLFCLNNYLPFLHC